MIPPLPAVDVFEFQGLQDTSPMVPLPALCGASPRFYFAFIFLAGNGGNQGSIVVAD